MSEPQSIKREINDELSTTYRKWEETVPEEIKSDSVWKSKAYRLALFASELAWHDAITLLKDKRTISLADQLYHSASAISADIEEGFSRGTGRDRARFYEYALGSAREARGWYFKSRRILGHEVLTHRNVFLTQIIRLLLTMIPEQRGHVLHEDILPYQIENAARGFIH